MGLLKNNDVVLFGKYQITAQERESRIETMQYAIASVELEGLPLSNEAKEVFQAYADGDLNFQERAEQIKLLASSKICVSTDFGNVGQKCVQKSSQSRYQLSELLATSDYSKPQTTENREWVDAPSVGGELV